MVQDPQPCRAMEVGHDSKATRLARIAPRRSTRVSPRTITLYSYTEAGHFSNLFLLAPNTSNDNGRKETYIRSTEVGGTRFTNSTSHELIIWVRPTYLWLHALEIRHYDGHHRARPQAFNASIHPAAIRLLGQPGVVNRPFVCRT
jgi:hypothetical protein